MNRDVPLWLLVPAPAVFALRAILEPFEVALPWPFFAAVGVLSAIGLLGLVWTWWPTADRWDALAATVVALAGHYVVGPYLESSVGAAMVYLGTGIAGRSRCRWSLPAAGVAAVGALLRAAPTPWPAAVLVFVGGLGLAWALASGARSAPLDAPQE